MAVTLALPVLPARIGAAPAAKNGATNARAASDDGAGFAGLLSAADAQWAAPAAGEAANADGTAAAPTPTQDAAGLLAGLLSPAAPAGKILATEPVTAVPTTARAAAPTGEPPSDTAAELPATADIAPCPPGKIGHARAAALSAAYAARPDGTNTALPPTPAAAPAAKRGATNKGAGPDDGAGFAGLPSAADAQWAAPAAGEAANADGTAAAPTPTQDAAGLLAGLLSPAAPAGKILATEPVATAPVTATTIPPTTAPTAGPPSDTAAGLPATADIAPTPPGKTGPARAAALSAARAARPDGTNTAPPPTPAAAPATAGHGELPAAGPDGPEARDTPRAKPAQGGDEMPAPPVSATVVAAPPAPAAAVPSGVLRGAREAPVPAQAAAPEPADPRATALAASTAATSAHDIGPSTSSKPVATTEPRGAEAPLNFAATLSAAAAPSRSPEPTPATLQAPVGTPAFASQLGVQLSTFARDGVQHARLELNPAELGPVTVQIQMDGPAARIDFAAEHAQTRQAIEQALPALAANLRESGLTLSGGGVFEQPRQPQGQAQGGGGRTGPGGRGAVAADADDGGSARAIKAPLRRRGVVDLVA